MKTQSLVQICRQRHGFPWPGLKKRSFNPKPKKIVQVYHSSANTSSRLRARTQIMHDNTKEVSRKERQAELMRQRILSKQEMGSHLSSHLSTTPLEAEYKIEAYWPAIGVDHLLTFFC